MVLIRHVLQCGDIVKVTPSSKVVGDFAQFLVSNKLSRQDVIDQADKLDFPNSVVEFFQGYLGQPVGGFPEPLRSKIIRDKKRIDGRPGKDMPPYEFERVRKGEGHGREFHFHGTNAFARQNSPKSTALESARQTSCRTACTQKSLKSLKSLSTSMVTCRELLDVQSVVFARASPHSPRPNSVIPTRFFLGKPKVGEEIHVPIEKGKVLIIKLIAVSPVNVETGVRDILFELVS